MGFHTVIRLLTPGDRRTQCPYPRREGTGRRSSQRALPFSPPPYEAPPPPYETLSTASARSESVLSNSDTYPTTASANSGGLVAPSGAFSKPRSSHSSHMNRPHSSYTPTVDHHSPQASAEEIRRSSRTSEEGRRSSRSVPDLSHELTNDWRKSTVAARSDGTSRRQTRNGSTNVYKQRSGTHHYQGIDASYIPRSSEQARVTTGFATYDEWCSGAG